MVSGKIPIFRRIEVACTAERLILWPRRVTVPFTQTVPDAARRLLEEIDREVTAWGPAGEGFRWAPELRFRVDAAGLDNFYQLRLALHGQPYSIEHELVIESDRLFDPAPRLPGTHREGVQWLDK
jgi:hypothetical protein